MGFGDEVGVGKGPSIAFNFWGPFSAGVAPILIPHKNKARFIILTDESMRQDAHMAMPFQLLENAIEHYEVHTPIFIRREIHELTTVVHSRHYDVVHDTANPAPCTASIIPTRPSGAFYPPPVRPALHSSRARASSMSPVALHSSPYSGFGPQLTSAICHPQHYGHRGVEHVVEHAYEYGPVLSRTEFHPAGMVHQSLARPVTYMHSGYQVWSQSSPIKVFDVIETNNTMIMGGLMGFVAAGPLAFGVGLLGHGRWDITSHRKIASKESAYLAPELDAPKSLQDVQMWPDNYTSITWSQLRGIKIVAGLYMIAHAGTTTDVEGIWEHTVVREKKPNSPTSPESEIITVTLSLKKQTRLKATAGVVPFFAANKDLAHAAKSNKISFKFININSQPGLIDIANKLIEGLDNASIARAKEAADFFAQRGYTPENAPISFIKEINRSDNECRDRLRARLPLIANVQKIKKRRDRYETHVVNVGGQEYTQTVLVTEIVRRKEKQYPIESIARDSRECIYPQRTGIDASGKMRWPLDYRNSHFEEITQVRDKKQGDVVAPYEVGSAKFIWNFLDNYISHEKFLKILEDIGNKTGLAPILFQSFNVPEFTGPLLRFDNKHETMQISLEIHLRESDKQHIFQNLLQTDFVQSVMHLFDAYTRHPRGDYLHLTDKYSSQVEGFKVIRLEVQKQVREVVELAHKTHEKMLTGKKRHYLMSKLLSESDRMRLVRDLLDELKVNPFVFLASLNRTTPNSVFEMRGTSVNLQRTLDVALARNIIENNASIPEIYMQPIAVEAETMSLSFIP